MKGGENQNSRWAGGNIAGGTTMGAGVRKMALTKRAQGGGKDSFISSRVNASDEKDPRCTMKQEIQEVLRCAMTRGVKEG